MKAILVVAKNRTGLMADVSEQLTRERINIDKIFAEVVGSTAFLRIETNAVDAAFLCLSEAGFNVISEAGMLVRVRDEAGALARIARDLADCDIDIRGINMVEQHDGFNVVSISCSDDRRAREVLGDIVVETPIGGAGTR